MAAEGYYKATHRKTTEISEAAREPILESIDRSHLLFAHVKYLHCQNRATGRPDFMWDKIWLWFTSNRRQMDWDTTPRSFVRCPFVSDCSPDLPDVEPIGARNAQSDALRRFFFVNQHVYEAVSFPAMQNLVIFDGEVHLGIDY